MVDTRQLVILKRLTTLLEGITPANGYAYTLTGRVHRGRVVFGDDTPVPFLTIVESLRPDPSTISAGTSKLRRLENWELLIQGWAKVDTVHPTDDLYGLKGAVENRLARIQDVDANGNPVSADDYRLGRLIDEIFIGPGVVRPQHPQSGSEALYLPLTIRYMSNVSDPWA